MVLIAAIQWILGPHQSYNYNYQHFKYYMYVGRLEYMQVIVPGTIAFGAGVLFFYPKLDFQRVNKGLMDLVAANPNLPIVLIVIGILSSFLINLLPPAFSFVIFLMSNFRFVGAALWLFKATRVNTLISRIAIIGLILLSSVQAGMFHELLLWSALLLSFVVLRFQLGIYWRLVLVLFGFSLAFLIQSVKAEYRDIIYSGLESRTSTTEVFADLVEDRLKNLNTLLSNEAFLAEMNVRLNQGWIISAIMKNVPNNQPYAEGETIVEAVKASFLPRFLAPGKKIAGGRENFEIFTGLKLNKNASMGISIIGEAYANFGREGSWVFMFFWGAFMAWGLGRLVKSGEKQVIIFVFIPLIFLQVIKAETELYVVLNHFVKSTILVVVFLWGGRKILNWKV
ncbi:O-antigen polysaccharide polymerase Wzy [Fulvivirga sp. M361]|uniref:O-antigen polysaccharide polymerase Wzy n=1 Tax=Fulvivirga sp. M361 TaxID=2594266 RepID=UPI00117AC265|nr:O-antigen polysaccharide polymerase Wzy [Fulvivirga sp. M361]TRX50232.1 O-antigen polysaccharide polymerase Wzy [Fulvivirga sp. M361]